MGMSIDECYKWVRNANYRKNPCKDCPDKGCGAYHSICKYYIAWAKGREEDRKRKLERCEIADTLRTLEHHRCTTKRRLKGAYEK